MGNLVAVVFVYFLCPETGGKALEEIDWIFAKPGTFAPGDQRAMDNGGTYDAEEQKDWSTEEKHMEEVRQAAATDKANR